MSNVIMLPGLISSENCEGKKNLRGLLSLTCRKPVFPVCSYDFHCVCVHYQIFKFYNLMKSDLNEN